MIDIDKWQEILHTLQQHKLRTALTAFGVFWGIFMLVMLLGAGKGLENGAVSRFGAMKNAVFMWSTGKTQIPYQGMKTGRNIVFSPEDLRLMRANIADIDLLSAVNHFPGEGITRNGKTGSFSGEGLEADALLIEGYTLLKGRFINDLDMAERRKVAVIGTEVLDLLFEPGENPIGETIQVQDIPFVVIGVFTTRATGEQARRDAQRVIIPNSTLRYTFNSIDRINYFQMTPKPGVHAKVLEETVREFMRERHRVHPDDRGVIASFNMQEEYDKVNALFTGVRVFSWVVALGTIFAGVIGVGNIMLIVVKERTREIGVRKALGATSWNIIGMIVQEALVLTFLAGYFGLVAGVFLLQAMSNFFAANLRDAMFLNPEIDFATAFAAIVVLVLAGVAAALLPASKAAKVDPILALQDE